MKRKLLCTVILLLLGLFIFASCKVKSNEDDKGNASGDSSLVGDGVIFKPGEAVAVVKSKEATALDVSGVWEKLYGLVGDKAVIKDDGKEKASHEIVIGASNRSVTAKAMAALESGMTKVRRDWEDRGIDTSFLIGYAVYSDGESLALVWSNEDARGVAMKYLINNYFGASELKLEAGYVSVQGVDRIEVLRANEQAKRDEIYEKIAMEYGAEVSSALRDYLSMIDSRFYIWLADLYDPGEYDSEGNPLGGGFYYSNSGRDTAGYGVDLESTMQAMSWLISAGLAKDQAQLRRVLPESMFKEMAAFVLSCQSSVDGYFYHPQWGTNVTTNRLGRDCDWATDILALCGEKPYWDVPNGVEGKYGKPLGYEVDPKNYSPVSPSSYSDVLSRSAASAVSAIIPTASGWTGSSQLASISSWEEYLLSFEKSISGDSYSIGNTFNAQSSQIKARDAMALSSGELADVDGDGLADGGYIELFEKYFNEWQNYENGLWESCSVSGGTVYYNAINGLMKIVQLYNDFGIKFNYVDKAFECAAFMASYIGKSADGSDWADSKGKKPTDTVDVFNPWVAMKGLLQNARKFDSKDASDALRAIVQENALEMISVTARKVAKFKKQDGSYGYTWGAVMYKSQGAPVAVQGTVEGDVNGATLSFIGAFNYMRGVLEFDEALKPFGYSDLLVFAERIKELEHVIKDDVILDTGVGRLDFEDDTTGDLPENATTSLKEGSVEVMADPDKQGNQILKFVAIPGSSGNSFAFVPATTRLPSGIVFEMRLRFDTITQNNDTALQIRLDDAYMLTVGTYTDGTFSLGDSSSRNSGPIVTRFDAKFNAYEWNTVRVEYYLVGAEKDEAVIQIYVNGDLRFVSTNYYGIERDIAPTLNYGSARVFALKDTKVTCYFDDLYAAQTDKKYVERPIVNPDFVKDFEGTASGVSGGSIISSPKAENSLNKALSVKGGATANISASVTAVKPNLARVSTKILIPTSASGTVAKLYLAGASIDKSLYAYELAVSGGVASLTEITRTGERGNTYTGLPVGEWFTLTLEFYPYFYLEDASSVVYLNGSEIGRGNTNYYIGTVSSSLKSFTVVAAGSSEIILDDIAPEWGRGEFPAPGGGTLADPEVEFPEMGKSSSTAAGAYHDGRFDFESAELGTPKVAGLATSVNVDEYGNYIKIITDPTDAANKVLMHKVTPSTVKGNSTSYAVSRLSEEGANCHVFEFDVYVKDGDPNGLQISMNGVAKKADGTSIDVKLFQTNTYLTGTDGVGTLNVQTKRDHTASLPHASDSSATADKSANFGEIIPEIRIAGWVNIRYELYTELGVVKIYYDGEYRGETDVVYNNQMGAEFTAVNIFNIKGTAGEFYFDNVTVESVVKEYVSETCADETAPAGSEKDSLPEAEKPKYDAPTMIPEAIHGFDDGKISITVDKDSPIAEYSIVNDPIKGAVNKVLCVAVNNANQTQDENTLAIYNSSESSNPGRYEFSVDVCWDVGTVTADTILAQFVIKTSSGTLEIISLKYKTNGKMLITADSDVAEARATLASNADIADGRWHNLRFVIDQAGKDTMLDLYIDGVLISSANCYQNSAITEKDGCIDKVILRARKCSSTKDGVTSNSYNYYIDNAYLVFVSQE